MQTKYKLIIGFSASVVLLGSAILIARKRYDLVFDLKTNRLLLGLQPEFRKKAIELLKQSRKLGIELRLISGVRGCDEQNRLYAQGRTAAGNIVTNAKCGMSAHQYGIAADFVEFKEGKPQWNSPNWETIGRIGESLDLEWGGRWKFTDKPHFQFLQGKSISNRYQHYQQTGKLIA